MDRCHHCGREYHTRTDDALRANIPPTDWVDLVCKRCVCYLRGYHRWTITDQGVRLCADCFQPRLPIDYLVRNIARRRRKRELLPK